MNNLIIFKGKEVEIFEYEVKVLFNTKHVAKCLVLSDSATRNHLSKINSKQAF